MTYEELLKQLINKDYRFMVLTAENRAAIRNLPNQKYSAQGRDTSTQYSILTTLKITVCSLSQI